jgi:DNA-binding ferritin-like protein
MNTAEQLTQIFRDNFVAYFRSHVAHVNITGRNFTADHELLGGIYESLQSEIDIIGELLRTLREYMPCDMQEVLDESHIDTGELSGTADYYLEMVMEDLDHLIEEYRELIDTAEAEGHQEIANYAQDRVLALEKQTWQLRSTLE